MLCSADGKHYAWASAFAEVPQKISSMLPEASAKVFWRVVAELADSVFEQNLCAQIHCPHCASSDIAFWEGQPVGSLSVTEASFLAASALSAQELQLRVSKISSRGTGA